MATCLDHNFTQCMTIIMFARTCISACVRVYASVRACMHAYTSTLKQFFFLFMFILIIVEYIYIKKKADDGNMDVT